MKIRISVQITDCTSEEAQTKADQIAAKVESMSLEALSVCYYNSLISINSNNPPPE